MKKTTKKTTKKNDDMEGLLTALSNVEHRVKTLERRTKKTSDALKDFVLKVALLTDLVEVREGLKKLTVAHEALAIDVGGLIDAFDDHRLLDDGEEETPEPPREQPSMPLREVVVDVTATPREVLAAIQAKEEVES